MGILTGTPLNTVDEVTQYEHIGCVQAISERFLVPVLEALIAAYPFEIQGFHVDSGSEYINHRVAALLNKLHIGQFTKSRARHCNDNALVEGKISDAQSSEGDHPFHCERDRRFHGK